MRRKCVKHPLVDAGWGCDACGATLCPDCTASRLNGFSRLDLCRRCGGYARVLKVPRGELEPFGPGALWGALVWPLGPRGLLSVGASTLLLVTFSLLGGAGSRMAVGVLLAYLFQIVRHTALGRDDFPGPEDFRGYWEDVVGPTFRLGIALAWIWVPAFAWSYFVERPAPPPPDEAARLREKALAPGGPGLQVRGMRVVNTGNGLEVLRPGEPAPPPSPEQTVGGAEPAPGGLPAPPRRRLPWVPVLLLVLGTLVAPMSLLASALRTPLSVAANPLVLATYAWRLGRDYGLLVAACGAAVGATLGLRLLGSAAQVPLAPVWFSFGQLLLAFAAFRAVGLLVRARGHELGYGSEEAYLVPVLGDAIPAHELGEQQLVPELQARDARGQWPTPTPAPTLQPTPTPTPTLEPTPDPPARHPTPIEVDLGPSAQPGELPADTFGRLLAQQDLAACAEWIEGSPTGIPHTAAEPATWLQIAAAGLATQHPKGAIVALRRCVEAAPQGALAPRAWLLAARTYSESLLDRATSDRLLGELVRRFPDSAEGQFAKQLLAQRTAPSLAAARSGDGGVEG